MAWVLKMMDEVIESVVQDFDASLSDIGQELGAGVYNMSDVLALPIFKQEDCNLQTDSEANQPPFRYVLCAATSPSVKLHDETLTYLNQGQSYELRMLDNRTMGDLPEINGQLVKSIIRVVFHDRRLQYSEHQHLEGWRWNRPGDRLLDLDIPMCVGIIEPGTHPGQLNAVEFLWDPSKRSSAFLKVHCISTEFTPRKHGGEKGVPFRIQVDTLKQNENGEYVDEIHSASCQIKVFKPKGADRKQKTDREKIERKNAQEKERYQPSYETTVLAEMITEPIIEDAVEQEQKKSSKRTLPADCGDFLAKRGSCSPWPELAYLNTCPTTPPAFTSTSQNSTRSVPESNTPSPTHHTDVNPKGADEILHVSATTQDTQKWLLENRFSSYARIFSYFSGADLLKLSREDLIEICGPADGIRLFNALKSRSVRPRLTVYVCQDHAQSVKQEQLQNGDFREKSNGVACDIKVERVELPVYHAIYLEEMTASEVTQKIAAAFKIPLHHINQVYRLGPSGIHIVLSNQMVQNFEDESGFIIATVKAEHGHGIHLVLK